MRACARRSSPRWSPGLPDAAEAAPPPLAGYSVREAAKDLLAGAFRARHPARRRGPTPLGWGWQAGLVGLSGLASGVDIYLREPFQPSDVPPDWAGWLPLLNIVGNPAISVFVSLLCWLLMIGGGKLLFRGRLDSRDLGSGLALGWWSATLPVLGAIALGLALALKSDTIALMVAVLVTAHIVPSLAESCGLTIGQGFGVVFLGPLALILLAVAILVGFGFLGKLAGIRLLP